LTVNKTLIEDFPSPETRMLLITEGLSHTNNLVRDACVEFITPSILAN
jgi:hypothetical protein